MLRRLPALVVGAACVAAAGRTFAFVPGGDVALPVAPPDDPVVVADPGALLPAAPDVVEVVLPPATAERIRQHLEAGDTARALRDAERLVAEKKAGRERDAALMVVGLLHREAGLHNLASDAFTNVRAGGGPLASEAAFYEAEQDLRRGREWAAIKECETLRATWPLSRHAAECLRVVAQAHAAIGNPGPARSAAAAYDLEHELGTISEQVELELALGVAEKDPERAVPLLRRLATTHDAPLTGRVAEQELARIGAGLSDDVDARMQRAVSLRDSGRRDEAWAELEALAKIGEDDVRVKRWVDDNVERFGWRTRRWDALADWYAGRYAATGGAEDAWNRYKALVRGARFDEASTLALEMQEKHAATSQWRRSQEDVARTLMLARRYPEARDQLDQVAARGGWTGRRAATTAAFAALMSGDAADAVARYDRIVADGRNETTEALYWRARAHALLERSDLAEADRATILATDPWSWYGVLVAQGFPAGVAAPAPSEYARGGRWVGPAPAVEPEPLPDAPHPDWLAAGIPTAAPLASGRREGASGFASLSWGGPAAIDARVALGAPPAEPSRAEPPASYRPSALFDPASARRALWSFAEQHGDAYPELRAIADLASIGLYDLSGPRMSAWFEEVQEDARWGIPSARDVAATPGEQLRPVFLGARDHHHTARWLYGLWDTVTEPGLQADARRLGFPLAHDRYVWTASREHDVDPFLVLGLMRQESTYDSMALSKVGARGAMQIMPKTGHLLADLQRDTSFTAADLEDPTYAVGQGITYLGMLLDRFDGVYPLAVASYNGGPFNVSSWLQGAGTEMPMDAFVEHIPFKETRDYVKKVSEGYAAYVALYAPDGADVVVPATALGDHPEVVDF